MDESIPLFIMSQEVIYFCTNDGTDARVSKEIKTLTKNYKVHFFGFLRNPSQKASVLELCATTSFVCGRARSIIPLLHFLLKAIFGLSKYRSSSIHVVDEELLIFLFPFLIGRRVVLDIFDSLLLRLNKPKEKLIFIKRILYSLPKVIIVTDNNRKQLLPSFVSGKVVVVPNVPIPSEYPTKKEDSDLLRIYLVGSLSSDRGVLFARKLLEADQSIKITVAGWIYDEEARNFVTNPLVEYLGILPQHEVNAKIANDGDYILAIYPLTNVNNKNASPNKIYDSLHTKTPIIISSGTYASKIVQEMNIGIVVDTESEINFLDLSVELRHKKRNFVFRQDEIEKNSWNNYEEILNECHC